MISINDGQWWRCRLSSLIYTYYIYYITTHAWMCPLKPCILPRKSRQASSPNTRISPRSQHSRSHRPSRSQSRQKSPWHGCCPKAIASNESLPPIPSKDILSSHPERRGVKKTHPAPGPVPFWAWTFSGGTNATGQLNSGKATFLQVTCINAWYVHKTLIFPHLGAPSPQTFAWGICGSDCDKKKKKGTPHLQFGNILRFHWGAPAEKIRKICLKTSSSGWFALKAGSNKSEENTGIYYDAW